MLLTIQFPLCDIRSFLGGNERRLERPAWPSAEVGTEFIRSFGGVTKRFRGGLSGWIGEGRYCDARRVVRFSTGMRISVATSNPEATVDFPMKIIFVRLYADGSAVTKCDIGISIPWAIATAENGSLLLPSIKEILRAPVEIVGPRGSQQTVVARAGKALANAYRLATGREKRVNAPEGDLWTVTAGRPLLFLERNSTKILRLPDRSSTAPHKLKNLDLQRAEVDGPDGTEFPIWLMSVAGSSLNDPCYGPARKLRICLMRLHAECECLRITLLHLAKDKLLPEPRSPASGELQNYLLAATRHISGLQDEAGELTEDKFAESARQTVDAILPDERSTVIEKLKQIDARKNILRKADSFVKQQILIMQDNSKHFTTTITGHGNAVNIGETLNQCSAVINNIENSERKATMEQLHEQVKQLIDKLPPDKAKEKSDAAESLKRMVKVVTDKEPEREWYSVSAEGLLKAAKWVGDFGVEIGKTVTKLGGLIWKGFTLG